MPSGRAPWLNAEGTLPWQAPSTSHARCQIERLHGRQTKHLADNNKRRTSPKPTNNQSALGPPVVQTGAASATIACRKGQARSLPQSVP